MIEFEEKERGLSFIARIIPRASKSEIVGEHDGALKIRIASPPVNGAANAELIKLLSKAFGVSKSEIEILGGQTSKTKKLRIKNATVEKVAQILNLK